MNKALLLMYHRGYQRLQKTALGRSVGNLNSIRVSREYSINVSALNLQMERSDHVDHVNRC